MRCFVAIPIPEPVKEHIWNATVQLREEYPRIGWVRPEGMHITLAFLGEVPDGAVAQVKALLMCAALPQSIFEAQYEGLGQFPERGNPRVLYSPIRKGKDEMYNLWESVSSLVRSFMEKQERRFIPHITLARIRDGREPIRPVVFSGKLEGSFQVDRCILYESLLKRTGAEYRPLCERVLGGE